MNNPIRVTIPDELKNADFIDQLRLKFVYPESDTSEFVFRNVEVLHVAEDIDEQIKIRESSVSFFGQTFIFAQKSDAVSTYDRNERSNSPIDLSNVLVVKLTATWNDEAYSKKKSIIADKL